MIEDIKPSAYANSLGEKYSSSKTQESKKAFGQYFTPLDIARFMGSLASCSKSSISILDPGCGSCILSLSLIEYLTQNSTGIKTIELTVYEIDKELIVLIKTILSYTNNWLLQKGIIFQYNICSSDFILDNAICLQSLFAVKRYDYIISNPPYFKLSKNDLRVKATAAVLLNQPNIYSIFLSISSNLLHEGGEIIFIIPRSFTSGSYFKNFREYLFARIKIELIHLFDSRKSTFAKDSVLQELLILKGTAKRTYSLNSKTILSYSFGISDIMNRRKRFYSLDSIIDFHSKEKIIHLPATDIDEKILRLFKRWKNKLGDYGLQISTGPVVAFRMKSSLVASTVDLEDKIVPLYWLHNINKMFFEWPKEVTNKEQYIKVDEHTNRWLVSNRNLVLIRRFSAKDDKSRLVAAPYRAEFVNSHLIGIENKLNYIYSKRGVLTFETATGIAALLNCSIFDTYFRMFNGNVNVSASELREMTFPPLVEIERLGALIVSKGNIVSEQLNELVVDFFNLESLYEKIEGSKENTNRIGVA